MESKRLGQYQFLDKIDLGGMAEIFRARQIGPHGFEKVVAIKVILPHLSMDKEFVTMFSSEARVTAQLQHPNIVQIYDFACDDETYYIAMEYIHGLNLNDLLMIHKDSKRILPLNHVIYIVKHLCSALEYAHELTDFRGNPLEIVHRDINPKNIMISFGGEIKLMDFGIALAATRCFQTTADGMIRGKIAYLSPEQVRSTALDKRSDIFSLGIVFYELVTKKRPFDSDNEFGILHKIEKGNPDPPSTHIPDFPVKINDIIMKCLAPDRNERYQKANEIRLELENFEKESNNRSRQIDFKQYLEMILGKDVVQSPLIPSIEDLNDEPSEFISEKIQKPRIGSKSKIKANGIDTSEIITDEIQLQVTPERLPDLDDDISEEIESVWRKKSTWEKLRFPLVVITILLISGALSYYMLGGEGLQRLLGVKSDLFETNISISVEPKDAIIELDFKTSEQNPISRSCLWQPGTKHILSITHQAHRPIKLLLQAPNMEDNEELIIADIPKNIQFSKTDSGYTFKILMIPDYMKIPIESNPSGVGVFINDIDTKSITPMVFSFQTDKQSTIRAEKKGYKTSSTVYQPDPFSTGNKVIIELNKIKPPTPKPVPKGKILVRSTYPVDVYRGNKRLYRNISSKSLYFPEGSIKLRFINKKYCLNRTETINVRVNKTRTITIKPTGVMITDADPPNCKIFIQDIEIGTAPGQVELAPGLYNVIFKWEDCEDVISRWVKINSQQNKRVPKVFGCR